MYLSLLWLNPASRQAMGDLADVQALHVRLMSAFPEGAGSRAKLDLLHRVERDRAGRPRVLVQSRLLPDWSRLPARYLVSPPTVKSIDKAFQAITRGMRLRFRLRANPTKRLLSADHRRGLPERVDRQGKEGKRVALLKDEDRLAWLQRKAREAGFRVVSAIVRAEPDERGQKAGGPRLVLSAATFDGVLEVEDADKLRTALTTGIGPGKAYGFGLLSVARCE
ncbi:MAG: CRISPR-associated endoribonuclease Cse3 [Dehalococcoidia bacterium]|jgi:CRISPR system Cascade subunit CasE|nr:MAG: CRISPR-associated endoribonuclease Cse3 [Dehalococcoidia bacterium]